MLDEFTRLGSYEIVNLLGKGGMGEVYRAHDSKLGRDVAVKVLPEIFAQDMERIVRFKREAKVLASLNHANIATLYGMEESNGKHFLVMELVEGETLAEKLRRGPIAVEDALKIAAQVANALEAAHEKGVIHRDLKPANIKITPDHKVKVLDFGLAKAMDSAPGNMGLSNSPTLTAAATNAGVILGTAAYMSPEQAKGQEADGRSDTFSFGCVLYEMLAGRQAFQGESISEILAAVLVHDPNFSVLPPNLNPRLLDLIRQCLEKNPKRRWHAIGDVRIEIEKLLSDPSSMIALPAAVAIGSPLWKRALPVLLAALVSGVAVGLTVWSLRPSLASPAITKFPLVLPADQTLTPSPSRQLDISADGTKLVYVANGQLYMRKMSEMEARPIPGTGGGAFEPFFSPDGQWVGFVSLQDLSLKKIAVTGGAPIVICKAGGAGLYDATWEGDHILFVEPGKGVMRVSENGGEPEVFASVPGPETAWGPQILDGGKALLFTLAGLATAEGFDQAQVVVQPLPSGQRKVIVRGGSDARYVPSGHIIYSFGGNVRAIPFDLKKLETRGSAVGVLDGVMRVSIPLAPDTQLSFSSNGALAYIPGEGFVADRRVLALADRTGKIDRLPVPAAAYLAPRFSPDGKHIAFEMEDSKEPNVYVYDIGSGTEPRRLTFGGRNEFPTWSRDGRYVIFTSNREGDTALFRQPADGGPAERLTKPERGMAHIAQQVDPSGKTLALWNGQGISHGGIWLLDLEGDRQMRPFVEADKQVQIHSSFSPDGHWLAYMSTEQGLSQIFVQPYPKTGAKYQVTTDLGAFPLWSSDGKQLFYTNGAGLFVVDVRTEPAPSFGKPSPVPLAGMLQPPISMWDFDIRKDGKFVVVVPDATPAPSASSQKPALQINVVLNWFEELKQRVPVR
jgi:serine/threonine-protein kinase